MNFGRMYYYWIELDLFRIYVFKLELIGSVSGKNYLFQCSSSVKLFPVSSVDKKLSLLTLISLISWFDILKIESTTRTGIKCNTICPINMYNQVRYAGPFGQLNSSLLAIKLLIKIKPKPMPSRQIPVIWRMMLYLFSFFC